jgi:hypothetical protein
MLRRLPSVIPRSLLDIAAAAALSHDLPGSNAGSEPGYQVLITVSNPHIEMNIVPVSTAIAHVASLRCAQGNAATAKRIPKYKYRGDTRVRSTTAPTPYVAITAKDEREMDRFRKKTTKTRNSAKRPNVSLERAK